MGEQKQIIFVNFCCQRCLQPLNLDESFDSISEHTMAELSLPIHTNSDIDLESQTTSLDHYIPKYQLSDSGNGTNGFTLISNSDDGDNLSYKLRKQAELFDTLSSHSDIDYPLCEECTDTLLEMLEMQLKATQDDYNDYVEFLKRLESSPQQENLESLEKELEDLQNEKQRLLLENEELKNEEIAILESIKQEKAERERLKVEEDLYWKEYTKYKRELILTEDEHTSVESQLQYVNKQLDKFKKTNVFNETFHIWHSGHYGTINNFRLGRLQIQPVDWSEINAAWGQTALLLTALARKMNLTFEKYKVVPYGNHSYIKVLADNRELPLYGAGGFKYLWDSKHDAAIHAFLDCLQQLKEKLEVIDPDFLLPYRMNKESGKIEDVSTGHSYLIKIQFNSEEQWTKALKFLLTNLKWILAWVSSQFSLESATSQIQL